MKKPVNRFFTTYALMALLLCSGVAKARHEFRIDGSSDKSVERSYVLMLASLSREEQEKLVTAVVKLSLVGVSSAEEMLAGAELRNFSPVRIKSQIVGLTSAEIIALASKTSTAKAFIAGQEPGVSAVLLTPLAAGDPPASLESTQWNLVATTNGFTQELTLGFEPGGQLKTEPPSTAGVSTWEQSADEVRIFINDRYAVYRGNFLDGDHMSGNGGKKVGSAWTWTAERR